MVGLIVFQWVQMREMKSESRQMVQMIASSLGGGGPNSNNSNAHNSSSSAASWSSAEQRTSVVDTPTDSIHLYSEIGDDYQQQRSPLGSPMHQQQQNVHYNVAQDQLRYFASPDWLINFLKGFNKSRLNNFTSTHEMNHFKTEIQKM